MRTVRWRQIAEKLEGQIRNGSLPTGTRLMSSSTLAQSEGVSLVTAHKALEDLQRMGLVIRDGRRGTLVQPAQPRKTGRIALIVDQVDHVHSFPRPELLAELNTRLGEEYNLLFCDAKADPDREIRLLEQMSEEADGILCWPGDRSASGETMNRLVQKGVPLVLLDRVPKGAECVSTITDGVSGMRQSVEFLISRGHERIALLTFDKPEVSTVIERCETFERVMEEHKLSTKGLVRRFPASLEVIRRDYLEQAINDALFTMVHGSHDATALICVQDLFGVVAVQFAAEHCISIPDQLEIVTFNDWPDAWLGRPWQIHRLAFHPQEMASIAIDLLFQQIQGARVDPTIHRTPAHFVAADGLLQPGQSATHSKEGNHHAT